MKQSRLETKLDLMAIIEGAFYEYDDYVSECHEKDIEPHEGVEAFVADAIIKAGYSKVDTDTNVGGKTKDGDICRQNTPTNTPTRTNLHQLTPIEEMSAEIQESVSGCSSYWSGLIAEHLHEQGYRKQMQSEWISVKDRLPERDGRYLVYDVGLPRSVSTAEIRTIHFKKGDRYHEFLWRTHFTHWMPLPEPPKMKGGE